MLLIITGAMVLPGCKKFLEGKSDKKLVIPTTIADLQALLDNYLKVNTSAPSAGEASSDDYYLTDADYAGLTIESNRRMYTWQNSFVFVGFPNDWSRCYDIVYYCNIVLDGLAKIERNSSNEVAYDNLKGHALFLRGYYFFEVASIWCQAYDPSTAGSDLGIPVRATSDFNIASERGTLQETYDKIVSDLKLSVSLLPVTAVHVMRPSRAAAFAMLARVYLSMRNYNDAGLYADSSLQLYNKLLDYNTLSAAVTFPIAPLNVEITFENRATVPASLNNSRAKVDSVLYSQYAINDLRKTIFFKNNNNGTFSFKGSYEGSITLFAGTATDEMYLTRAECYARNGNTAAALIDLNTLLEKRWKAGTFNKVTATNSSDALGKILSERRKELLMRRIRWMDVKRLNKEGSNITMKRLISGTQYILLSNDLRYTLPIPEDVINISGMPQNPK